MVICLPERMTMNNNNKIIHTDIIKAMEQIDALKNVPDFLNTPEFKLNKQIINASSTYICKLEDIALSSEATCTYLYGW